MLRLWYRRTSLPPIAGWACDAQPDLISGRTTSRHIIHVDPAMVCASMWATPDHRSIALFMDLTVAAAFLPLKGAR